MYQSIPGIMLIHIMLSYVGVNCYGAKFIGNKQMHSQTNKH